MNKHLLMYHELAEWWPLLSAPADYAEEAGTFRRTIEAHARIPVRTVLELGSGGGNNASHLKSRFDLTLVDASEAMLRVSAALNPECAHVVGDMRSVRMGRLFDAVFVHDAVGYLATAQELAEAMETAFVHCREGGAALFVPDDTRETYRPGTQHGGHDGEDRAVRYLQWSYDPDPQDDTYVVEFVYVLREGDAVRSEHERHTMGLFSRRLWLEGLTSAGFAACGVPFEHSEFTDGPREMFVGVRA